MHRRAAFPAKNTQKFRTQSTSFIKFHARSRRFPLKYTKKQRRFVYPGIAYTNRKMGFVFQGVAIQIAKWDLYFRVSLYKSQNGICVHEHRLHKSTPFLTLFFHF